MIYLGTACETDFTKIFNSYCNLKQNWKKNLSSKVRKNTLAVMAFRDKFSFPIVCLANLFRANPWKLSIFSGIHYLI